MMMKTEYRTNTCGELTAKNKGNEVTLCGWVNTRRDHGGLIFIDLRDRYGLTQIVFDPKSKEIFREANNIRSEYVLQITGKVRIRPKGMINKRLSTGEIEILVSDLNILSKSKTPPFEISHEPGRDEKSMKVDEDLRLKYRYLDLRRKKIQQNLLLRQKVQNYMREFFDKRGFAGIETPILANTSPEGARDFLVPSRIHPGKFYALPQAPQQFKQLLMIGGMDRYYQIAPCMRDEDPRADRSPGEFYQLDLEMAFANHNDILKMLEELFIELTEKFSDKKVMKKPFPRLSWHEVVDKYGSDKPDLRFGMELHDITKIAKKADFEVFKNASIVKGISAPGCAKYSRKEMDELTNLVKQNEAKGLAWFKVMDSDKFDSQIAKFFKPEIQKEIISSMKAKEGDMLMFIADREEIVNKSLDLLRLEMGDRLKLRDPNMLAWAWITDFPFYVFDEEEGQITFMHNPFSMPKGEMKSLESKDPLEIMSTQNDLVANGYEVGSGADRNYEPEILRKAFKIAGYDEKTIRAKFGHMMEAFEYGAPPHSGFAPGIERMIMLLSGEKVIREVIAFPKNGKVQDLMTGAPSEATEEQLKELHIKIEKSLNFKLNQ